MNNLTRFLSDCPDEDVAGSTSHYAWLYDPRLNLWNSADSAMSAGNANANASSSSRSSSVFFSSELEDSSNASKMVVIVLCGSGVLDTVRAAANLYHFFMARIKQLVASSSSSCAPDFTVKLLVTGGVGHSTHFLYQAVHREILAGRLSPGIFTEQELEMFAQSVVREEGEEGASASAAATSPIAEADVFFKILSSNELDSDAGGGGGGGCKVPRSDILVERESTNCGANAELSVPLIMELVEEKQKRGSAAASSFSSQNHQTKILLIQDPTMQRRSRLSFERHLEKYFEHNYDAPKVVSVCCPFGRSPREKHPYSDERYLSLLLGEIPRLRPTGYGPLGKHFIGMCEIPESVEREFEMVVMAAARRQEQTEERAGGGVNSRAL